MKKTLLNTIILLCLIINGKAQTIIFHENFNGLTTAPTGWTQDVKASNEPSNLGWEFGNTWPVINYGLYPYIPAHGYYTFVDDGDYNNAPNNNLDTLYIPAINCSGYAHVFISFDALLWEYTGYEQASVAVSTNGGTTWSTAVNIANLNSVGGNNWSDSLVFDISSYAANKSNVLLAFTYDDGAGASGASSYGISIANINVFSPIAYDLSAVQSTTQYITTPGTPVTFTGTEFNWGGDSIVSMNINYTVNGGAKVTDALSSLSFSRCSAYNFSLSTPWTPSAVGNYTVKFWADNLNGSNVDMNNSNDTLYAYFTVVDTIQTKKALFEDFMQASCDPCLQAGANVESVLSSSSAFSNSFRYHPDWPGVDYMNEEIDSLFVIDRVNYYGVGNIGLPYGVIDGATAVNPGTVTSANIQTAANIGAPVTITITSSTYNSVTSTFNLQASIKSYADFPEAIHARVVLNVDTIKYDSNQSDEDPTSSFAPPLGTTTVANGGNPDNIYKYVKDFAQVAEEMLPDTSGIILSSLTIGQTRNINVSWKQNHAWGAQPAGENWHYDSLFSGEHFTVFVQDDQAAPNTARPSGTGTYPPHALSGAVTTYVYQSASAPVNVVTGIEELTNGVYFQLYPNPTGKNTTIKFSMEQAQNVLVDVYDALGEKVYSLNQGIMESGEHTILINTQGLQSGIYFVRFTTDNATTTKKLVVQH